MTTLLPVDANNYPIAALRLLSGGAKTVSVTASSARTSTAFDPETRVIGVYATTAMFIRFGSGTVTAATTDHYLPADTYMDISIAADEAQSFTHVAAVRATTDGTLYVSEKY
jgi:hypothetical protein